MGALLRYLRFHIVSLVSIAIRGLAVLLGFAITYYIGSRMGPTANGHYALITQTAMLLSIIAVGGLDMAIVRHFSVAVAEKLTPSLRSLLLICLISLAMVAVITVAMAVAAPYALEDISAADAPRAALLILGILFAARTVTRITSAFLRSQRAYLSGQVIEVVVIPGIVVLAILLQLASTLDAVLYWTAAGGILASLAGLVASASRTNRRADALTVPVRNLLRTAWPLWGVAVSANIADWYGLAVVAGLLSVYDAGLFRVAVQVGSALPIITVGIFSVFSPQIGAAFARRDYGQIARLTRSATRLSAVLVMPAAAVVMVFAEPILGLIGPEFREGALLLRIIVLGQAIYVCTGPSGLTLALTGHERVNLALTLTSLAVLLISVPLAARFGGITGAGIAISVVLVGRNIASLIAVRMLLGITILTGRYVPPAAHLQAGDAR